jgi:hypothetical protein
VPRLHCPTRIAHAGRYVALASALASALACRTSTTTPAPTTTTATSAAPARATDQSARLASAGVIRVSDALDDFGTTVDGVALGADVQLFVTDGEPADTAFVLAGRERALLIAVGRWGDTSSRTWAGGPAPYAEDRHAFPDAPAFPTTAPVLASVMTLRAYEIAWVITRDADALVVWIATGPYEDVTTDGARWERYVAISLAPGATVSTPRARSASLDGAP